VTLELHSGPTPVKRSYRQGLPSSIVVPVSVHVDSVAEHVLSMGNYLRDRPTAADYVE
jgi:hypothetical protein